MDSKFIIEGANPDHDISYRYIEKNEDLQFIEKGVPLKDFKDSMNKRNLELEFRLLRRLTENQLFTAQLRDYNPEFNKLDRYHTILPFKHSMIKLPEASGDGTEKFGYINASFLSTSKRGEEESKAFIATQGPLDSTRGSFWKMVWTYKVENIVMLCKFKENGRAQSDCYWKSDELVTDTMVITLQEEDKSNTSLIKRTFSIGLKDSEERRIIKHLQWIGWPDHGVPTEEEYLNIEEILELLHETRAKAPGIPIIVHCSAGIGRTGTLLSIYNIQQLLREASSNPDDLRVTVFGTVRRLREQRWGMVNNPDQYSFIYKYISDKIDKLLNKAKESS